MKKMLSKKILLSFFVLLALLVNTVGAGAAYAGNKYISSAGACVMDYDTGEILYEYNGCTARVPASMTKVMTMYCVYDALKNGEITLDSKVPISTSVYYKSRDKLYQNVLPLSQDVNYTVDEIMGVVISYSASAATVALAELVGGGSEANFVKRMNKKAADLGINAKYYDSCGVADNSISPVSMAILAKSVISEYPDILVRSSKKSVSFKGGTYRTTNHLLDSYYYEGADGLKTGTGTAAGACFCGTCERDGKRLIAVTMGSSSEGQRFTDTIRLFDYGYSIINDRINAIYHSDMRTFIDGVEMPTFCYCGKEPHAVIIAEDMANYGFDVTYNNEERKLIIKPVSGKAFDPIALDVYKHKDGQRAFPIIKSDIKVCISDEICEYELTDVYNVGGYMCISIDELAGFFDFVWSGTERAAYINTIQAEE